MEQNIEYTGMTSQPSDYACGDGEMKLAVNAEYRDGGYHAVRVPKAVEFKKDGFEPLFVHQTSDGNSNIIGITKDSSTKDRISSFKIIEGDGALSLGDDDLINNIETMRSDSDTYLYSSGARGFCAIGNIVSYINDGTLNHLVYKKDIGKYINYEGLPKYLNLYFMSVRQNMSSKRWSNVTQIINDNASKYRGFIGWDEKDSNGAVLGGCNTATIFADPEGIELFSVAGMNDISTQVYQESSENYKKIENYVFSGVQSIYKNLCALGLFMYPVGVRYAIKMYDGSYVNVSPPILVFPYNESPEVHFNGGGTGKKVSIDGAGFWKYVLNTGWIAYEAYQIFFATTYKDNSSQNTKMLEDLIYWRDLISSIDIFVSPPLYTIDFNKMSRLYFNVYEDGGNTKTAGVPKFIRTDGFKKIKDTSSFHLVRSIPIDEFIDRLSEHSYAPLLERGDDVMTYYTERETLKDNLYSNAKIGANIISSYNSRLIIGDIKKFYTRGFDLSTEVVPVARAYDDEIEDIKSIKVDDLGKYGLEYTINMSYIQKAINGTPSDTMYGYVLFDSRKYKYKPTVTSQTLFEKYVSDSCVDIFVSRNKHYDVLFYKELSSGFENKFGLILPKFISIPEAGANFLVLDKDGKNRIEDVENLYSMSLNQSDFVNASFVMPEEKRINEAKTKEGTQSAKCFIIPEKKYKSYQNLVKFSVANNPIVFNDGDSAYVGEGKVLAVAANVMPVSQGQFGQYPVYVFCDDGVYSLGIGSNGSLQTSTPYSYDVIVNGDSYGYMERTIVFASNQGIVSFDGSRHVILSSDKNATYAYDQGKNDHQKTFVSGFLNTSEYSSPVYTDLYTYLTSGAKIAYDYPHGRLIMYNPKYDYSYIMEAKSGMWSIMDKSFSRSLNVYEKCLLVDKDGQTVYDYSSDNVFEEQKSYLITRPFKLGAPDTHKSVQSIIQRGVFCNKEDVKQCLYASNDLYNWVPVKSSNSIYMRGMRGTGYKYFRQILFLPNFKQNEVLHGASITYEPRLTNKMR